MKLYHLVLFLFYIKLVEITKIGQQLITVITNIVLVIIYFIIKGGLRM